ncbi:MULTISPECIES: tRNA(5-methylaminomethyl-2-thiouridylate) methyltransferase [unclassified Desulfovibrio]|uniref:tRNA(5-methylaminomethyl-2-thiouridylate) methyltransferase n=1 Tax=unclassified Desulfovibrio TaxID=2593640 RepID=UPI0013ECEB29|nr:MULTISPECIES: tRNA(5-methylaminomethyl-2-thiouridylate) methyltransferase [unclassified Desulfovibrio]
MTAIPDAVVLFSGGLDSILAARVLMAQGLGVRCLHCVSPFFGEPGAVTRWRRLYGVDVDVADVSEDFAAMLRERPAHGFGKCLNPCVDCKILLLRAARRHMEEVGARFLASGEVLGQRPMSQRLDTLHLIPREAGVRGLLLRPLSARHLPPTEAEASGLVGRERLLGISGRGRGDQLALAREFGFSEIPTPGGGCRLTERENARRYWLTLTRKPTGAGAGTPTAQDFRLAATGRQYWREAGGRWHWLCVGRNNKDNERLREAAGPEDLVLRLMGLPGPLGLARGGAGWEKPLLDEAAAIVASCAPRAREAAARGGSVGVSAGTLRLTLSPGAVAQGERDSWDLPTWEEVREEIRAEARERAEGRRP